MYESDEEQHVKQVGWYNVIDNALEFSGSIEPYGDLANQWECCAIGEICGFPDAVYSSQLPSDLKELGDAFGLAVRNDRVEKAQHILHEITERKDEILELDDLWD